MPLVCEFKSWCAFGSGEKSGNLRGSKSNSKIFNWSKKHQVRGAPLCAYLFCDFFS